MEYIKLSADMIDRRLFANFIRHQVVSQCWRKVNGKWCIEDEPFIDDWDENAFIFVITCLKNTAQSGGAVFGAFLDGKLKGFSSVEPQLFGQNKEYLDLTYMHVSEDMRSRGIGKELFKLAKEWAKAHGAQKLYISAHSSVESQAFYKAMGCVEAWEYNKTHVKNEPYDCQMECKL